MSALVMMSEQNTDSPPPGSNFGTYMNDGVRKIDYILIYKEEEHKEGNNEGNECRKFFEENLEKEGLELETDMVDMKGELMVFVKVHVPWRVLCKHAERLQIKAPLWIRDKSLNKPKEKPKEIQKSKVSDKFDIEAVPHMEMQEKPADVQNSKSVEKNFDPQINNSGLVIHWPFKRKRLDLYAIRDQSTFFTEKQRIEIAYEILQKVSHDPKEQKKRGIKLLIEEGIYESAYPLHDGDLSSELRDPIVKTSRQRLKDTWANWKMVFHRQPMLEVRNYFGEKIGFYYAFMDSYTRMLVFPSFVGLVTFIIGVISAALNPEVAAICNALDAQESPLDPDSAVAEMSLIAHGSAHSTPIAGYVMCPICRPPGCSVWEMYTEGCFQYSWAFRLDNPWSFLLSSFTTTWAIFFLKYWKRREASLATEWGTEDTEEQDIVIRPEFEERAPKQRRNPVTLETEPHVPFGTGCLWLSASIIATVLFLLFACLCLMALVLSRIAMYGALKTFHKNVDLSRWLIHGFIFITVQILETAYSKLAHRLTVYECQRTEKQFMNSLLWKVFIFQILNDLIPLGYAAWVKGKTVRTPLNMRFMDELCDGGCMGEVTELVAVLLLLRLVIGNMTEIGIPLLKTAWKKHFRARKDNEEKMVAPQYVKDFHLNEVELDGVYEDYMEMMVQFAFIVLFIPALPVAPFVCLLNNIAEIRVDGIKMLQTNRRPLPIRVSGIGIWNKFLNIINKLGIICNAALLAFTSDNIPRLYYAFTRHEGYGYQGFTKFSLSSIQVIDYGMKDAHVILAKNITTCFYPDFRQSYYPFDLKDFYWEIAFIRMVVFASYCILFFTLTWVVNTFISDVPESVKTKIKRRNFVVQKALEAEAAIKQTKWMGGEANRTNTPHKVDS